MDFQQRAAEIERKRQQRIQRDQDEQTDAVLAQANDIAENVVNSADIRLDQLLQTGATAGQVVTWDAVAGEWVPDDASSLTDPTTTEGDVIYRNGSGLQRLGIGTAGQRLTVNSAETAPEWADDPAFQNIVLNPNGAIAQRLDTPTTPTTIDDTDYGYDRWKILSEIANSVDIQRIGGNTQIYAARLGQVDPTSQQIGTAQYIEGANCQHLRSNEVTLSGSLRCSANVTVKVVVVQWGGTEDVITNDLISSWGSTATLAANFTVAGTEGSVSLTANTWQDFSHTVTLNSSFNNLCVLLYVTTDIAQNTLLDYEAIKVSEGDFTTPFEPRPIGMELALCQRYFERIRAEDPSGILPGSTGRVQTSTEARIPYAFTEKRVAPSITSTTDGFDVQQVTTAPNDPVLTFGPISTQGCQITVTITGTMTVGEAIYLRESSSVTGAVVDIDAEL
jgi:hypothetical protein